MEKNEELIRADLAREIGNVESALSDFYENLQSITEDGLLDFYAYQIKAYEAKHRYLLGKIKEL